MAQPPKLTVAAVVGKLVSETEKLDVPFRQQGQFVFPVQELVLNLGRLEHF
jgi:hypothetical protein